MTTWNAMTEEGGRATPTGQMIELADGNALGSMLAQAQSMANDISGANNTALSPSNLPNKGTGQGFGPGK